ncbi:GAF domain-containing protein [Flavobacteriaceae bacterium F89]|uniref:histidine kinase n=1 Tax=Cerina litoralis TaxID=2874477 RepID=A0AAE3JR40_9FLAO|nr:two-component regulator propeller domain-containing protein [Cerina litoralis]MCG2459242.1 GAF domain-containing protein [Cerina litoralis]
MKKSTFADHFCVHLILSTLFLGLGSCNKVMKAPPLPVTANEYSQPTVKKFRFSKPDTIQWASVDPPKIKPLPTKHFDWDKLPTKPFDIGIPRPLKKPMEEKPFDWNSLPSAPFNMDSLPTENLTITVRPLGEPKIVKAGNLINPPDASRGVLGVDSNFGLPGTPDCILRDKDGMFWIGTNNSVVRYDSNNLAVYGSEQGLSSGLIYALFQDSKGRLWVAGQRNTVSIIDFDAQQVYELDSNYFSTSFGRVFDITEAQDGKFWMSNNGAGYNIIDLKERTVHLFTPKQGLLGSFTITLFQDKAGRFWLSTQKGANVIDLKKGKNYALTKKNGLMTDFTASFFEDTTGNIWIGGSKGPSILNKARDTISYFTEDQGLENNSSISKIIQDKTGTIWWGTNRGKVYSLSSEKNALEEYSISPTVGQVVNNLVTDDQGQIWVALFQGGLFKIDPTGPEPGNFTKKDGLGSTSFWSTLEAQDGKIWLGSYQGIDVYDPRTETVKHLDEKQGMVNPWAPRLKEDSKGRIWVCGGVLGVSIIDPKEETIQQLTSKQGLATDTISSIVEDKNGLYWMGGSNGELLTINLKNGVHKDAVLKKEELETQKNMFLLDRNGLIWIATLGAGIQRIDPKNNTRVHLTTEEGLSSDQVFTMAQDREGNIWAATLQGVQKIDPDRMELTTFITENGLAANDVYDVVEHKGQIYTGTSKGFSIIGQRGQTKDSLPVWQVRNIGKKQGLDYVDVAENSISFDKNGRLWAGVEAQILTVMNPIKEDTIAYPIRITGINLLDKKQVFKDDAQIEKSRSVADSLFHFQKDNLAVAETKSGNSNQHTTDKITYKTVVKPYNLPVDLSLPPDQNYLSFSYNGFQYQNPDKLVYSYFLEGIDKAWSPVSGKTTSENYRDLPPGDYTFKVASKGFNGVWSNPAELSFTILPPWWQTWWAYGAYAILLGLLFFGATRLQRRQFILKERQRSHLREMELRTEAAESDAKALQAENDRKKNVEMLSEIGKKITASLDLDEIFHKLYEHVNELADASIFGVGIYHPEKDEIEYRLAIEKGKQYPVYCRDTKNKNQLPVWCIENRKPVFINDLQNEYTKYIKTFKEPEKGFKDGTKAEEPKSIIYLPLISKNRVLGVITIQSFEKNAYTDFHLNLLQNLASYTAIALDNADAYRSLQATQAQLIQAEKMASLGELTAGIAHEIQNPLNFVNNFSEVNTELIEEMQEELKAGNQEEAIEISNDIRENQKKINHHGKRADAIVKGMLKHSRNTSGEKEPTNINAIADEYLRLAYHGLRAKDKTFNATLNTDFDESIGKINVVGQDIGRVLLNLITNALHAISPPAADGSSKTNGVANPTVWVSTKKIKNEILIKVKDNGSGIPKEIRDKIFQPFFTTKPSGQGTGLGLSMSYDIVRAHGGQLTVDSEPGKFTEFTIHLPIDKSIKTAT